MTGIARLTRSNLDDPEVRRTLGRGTAELARAGHIVVGRAHLEPGWRWSEDVRPAVGTSSCLVHHVHVLLAGRFAVRLDDGEEATFEPNDVFDLPPGHDAWVVGDDPVELLEISGNAVEFGLPATAARAIATLLMTDIVGSTARLAAIGDRAWKQTLADHERLVRDELRRSRGREIATTGDGFLAELDSAASALECALRIRDATADLGIEVRIGVHTGEIERVDGNVRGLAVHTAARVMSAAGPSQVFATMTTRLLSSPGPFEFTSRGEHELKGLPAPIELFEVRAAGGGTPTS